MSATATSARCTSGRRGDRWPPAAPRSSPRFPDPGDEDSRHELNKKIENITRWGTENGPALDYFRQEIRKAYGGAASRPGHVCWRRRDPTGGHATGLRRDCHRLQPGGLVHPEVHVGVSPAPGGQDLAIADERGRGQKSDSQRSRGSVGGAWNAVELDQEQQERETRVTWLTTYAIGASGCWRHAREELTSYYPTSRWQADRGLPLGDAPCPVPTRPAAPRCRC